MFGGVLWVEIVRREGRDVTRRCLGGRDVVRRWPKLGRGGARRSEEGLQVGGRVAVWGEKEARLGGGVRVLGC